MNNVKRNALAIACLTAAAPLCMAQPSDNVNYRDIFQSENWRLQPEFSIGASYGLTKIKDGDFDEDEDAYRGLATFKFNEFIGIEGSFIQFEEASSSNVLGEVVVDPEGLTLAVVLEIPFSQAFGLYGKYGRLWWDAETSVETAVIRSSEDFDGTEDFFGVGAKFRLAEHLDLKIEYERFQFDITDDELGGVPVGGIDQDVDHTSIGLQFTF